MLDVQIKNVHIKDSSRHVSSVALTDNLEQEVQVFSDFFLLLHRKVPISEKPQFSSL